MTASREVEPVVRIFYRAILADNNLSIFFDDVEIETQISKMTRAIVALLDCKPIDISALATVHAASVAKGLSDTHYDRVWSHLRTSLEVSGASADTIGLLRDRIESLRAPILGRAG